MSAELSSKRKQFEGGFNMLDFMLKITLIWLWVGPPVGTTGDGAGDDVLVAIRLAGSELHKHCLVCLSPATIVAVLAMTHFTRNKTRYVAENLSHNGSGKVFRARGISWSKWRPWRTQVEPVTSMLDMGPSFWRRGKCSPKRFQLALLFVTESWSRSVRACSTLQRVGILGTAACKDV